MLRSSVLSSVFLLLAASGCVTESDDTAPPAKAVAPIEVRGMFATDADRERFETDVLPSAQKFLAYWADAGLTIAHDRARLYISPPVGTKASVALPKVYGEGIFKAMRALEAEVAKAPSTRAAFDLMDAFSCEYPPLHRKLLDELKGKIDDPAVTPTLVGDVLRKKHDEMSAPDATFSFKDDNGEFEMPSSRKCSYILLGNATDNTRLHPYFEKDVVNHELGHGLHYGLWMSSGPVGERLSGSANEAIADIVAHVFDGDPCHGKVLDEQGAPSGCRRSMDAYESSVSDAVWAKGRGDHSTGQALREFIWSMREEVAADALRGAIRDGIAAVVVPLREIDKEPLSNVPVFDDDILAIRYRFAREYEATNAFFNAVCSSLAGAPRACSEHQKRIGDPRLEMRATWLANAPTAIGSQGVKLADGRRVAFEIEKAIIKQMAVTQPGKEELIYLGPPEIDVDKMSRKITLWFSPPGSSPMDPGLGWTSNGELLLKADPM